MASGLTVWHVVVMSLAVYAGGSQFAFVGVLAAGGSPAAAALSGLLLNTRLAAFGLVVVPLLTDGRVRRVVGTHLLADESAALAVAAPPGQARRVYWRTGAAIFAAWNVATVAGAVLGADLDPERYGLDVAFPATFVALLAPLLRDRGARAAAAVGVVVAVAGTPWLPPGVPIALAAVGALVGAAVGSAPTRSRP